MISLLYFLLASCFLIGCFANFAGNGYGYTLAALATSAFAFFLIPRGMYAAIKSWRESRLLALRILAEYWLAFLGVLGVLLKFNHFFGAGISMIAGFMLLSLIYFLLGLKNLSLLWKSAGRMARFEKTLLSFICSLGFFSTLAKFHHWEQAFTGLILMSLLLLLMFLLRIFRPLFPKDYDQKILADRYSPLQTYFFILLVGNLHFWGSLWGWIPGFQHPERPVQWVKIKEGPETANRNWRLDCFFENTEGFFRKRNAIALMQPADSILFYTEAKLLPDD